MTVTAPAGFTAAGVAAGLKASGGLDLALVVNTGPDATAAGVFTRNRIAAAPVLWSRQVLTDSRLRAVVLNSGGANACTGPDGFADTHRTAELVATGLSARGQEIGAVDVAVCSTGLIGIRLPMAALESGVGSAIAAASTHGGDDAAAAILTTDSHPKTAVVSRSGWSIGGMAKGAGMLAPGLATMLVTLTTDARVDPVTLPGLLADACATTFDRLDSDGCMSTNDSVILLSSGASGIAPGEQEFGQALTEICADLASQLLADAEGASHEIAITVSGAASTDDAVAVGRSIARSNLFKCAIFGQDPNWGRVLAALGTTSAAFEPHQVDVSFNGVQVCRASAIGEPRQLVDLSPRRVEVAVDLHAGGDSATIWTNDLTYDYVKENAEYSS